MYYDQSNMPELKEGTHIKGWLDLSGSQLTHLPNNLKVDYSLNLKGSSIKELPENLDVGYELCLNDTVIKKIPDSLRINENKEGIKGFILVNDLGSMTYSPKFKTKIADRRMMKDDLYGKVIDKKQLTDQGMDDDEE